jgi:hypothetical protein
MTYMLFLELDNISKASDYSIERRNTRREGRELAIIGGAYPIFRKVFSSLPLLFREMNIILMSILLALPSEPEFVNLLGAQESIPSLAESKPGLLKRLQLRALLYSLYYY